jgi:hypothetical protein
LQNMVYSTELIAGKKIRRNLRSEGDEFFGSLSMFGMILCTQLRAYHKTSNNTHNVLLT